MWEDREEVIEDIKNYQWMMKEYKRISSLSSETELPSSKGLMSISAMKSTETKAQNDRRIHKLKMKYEGKIKAINQLMDRIKNDRDYAVIHCITDGMNIKEVSKHIGISRRTVYSILERVASKALSKYATLTLYD